MSKEKLERAVGSRERAILVGVELKRASGGWSLEASLDELAALATTAGLMVVGRATQKMAAPKTATFIGPGKVEEVRNAAADMGADVVLIDHELSPRQQRNLERAWGLKVLDRPALILDVFAQHARTREGMLQVELAQYAYRLPRLTRMWTHLARQVGGRAGGSTGGVGVRGPGETQLEIDRREIRRRIRFLKGQIGQLSKQRKLYRRRRRRSGVPIIALVGYTNAGKSTLLNALSDADVYVADKLFATLDPTTRRVELPSGRTALFTDTVGFIQKLPPELVAAFRATLEEINDADVLLHVVDVTHTDAVQQVETVERVLGDLALSDARMVVAANKMDLVGSSSGLPLSAAPVAESAAPGHLQVRTDEHAAGLSRSAPGASEAGPADQGSGDALLRLRELYPDLVPISAATGSGLERLLEAIEAELSSQLVAVSGVIPYDRTELLHQLHVHGIVESESYAQGGVAVTARVPSYLLGALEGALRPDMASEAGNDAPGALRVDGSSSAGG